MDARQQEAPKTPVKPRGQVPRSDTPIVPRASIAGRALVAVVAIMTFLASLTTGALMLVRASAAEWQADVAREVTIQLRPASGRDLEADVARASELARTQRGVAEVRPYSKAESVRLLEPWLGTGLSLDDLPVPRLIVVRVSGDSSADLAQLKRRLAELPNAVLDDHRSWVERMRAVTATAVTIGIAILGLVVVATILSVTFATRGAMATNRPIVEVLHFIGARHAFIVGEFQRHFLVLGLQGGAIGGGAAILFFIFAELLSSFVQRSPGGDEVAALFGAFSIGILGYVMVLVQIGLISLVTAATSRHTVTTTLQAMD